MNNAGDLRQMQSLPRDVVTEAKRRCVIASLSLRVRGISQPRFKIREARWREVPLRTEDCVSGLEIRIDQRTEVEGKVVIKATDDRKPSELKLGIQLDSVGGKSVCDLGGAACGIGNECQVTVVLRASL